MKSRIRVYAGLLLILGLVLQVKVASGSSDSIGPSGHSISSARSGSVTTLSSVDSVMASVQILIKSIQVLMGYLQLLAHDVQAEITNKPQKLNTSGMSKEQAAKQQAQYEKALAMWRQRLTSLQRQLRRLQHVMNDAEKNLRRLLRTALPAAIRKDRQIRQRALLREKGPRRALRPRRPTIRAGNRKPILVVAKVRKTLGLLRKQRQEVVRLLGRIRGILQYRPGRKPSARSTAQTPALRGSGTPPAQ